MVGGVSRSDFAIDVDGDARGETSSFVRAIHRDIRKWDLIQFLTSIREQGEGTFLFHGFGCRRGKR